VPRSWLFHRHERGKGAGILHHPHHSTNPLMDKLRPWTGHPSCTFEMRRVLPHDQHTRVPRSWLFHRHERVRVPVSSITLTTPQTRSWTNYVHERGTRRVPSKHAEPSEALSQLRSRPLRHLQLLSASSLSQQRPRARHFSWASWTPERTSPLPYLRLRGHAGACSSLTQRATGNEAKRHLSRAQNRDIKATQRSPPALLATQVSRFQRLHSSQIHREIALYPSEPSEARARGKTGRLALEQLSPMAHRWTGQRPNRVQLDMERPPGGPDHNHIRGVPFMTVPSSWAGKGARILHYPHHPTNALMDKAPARSLTHGKTAVKEFPYRNV